MASGFQIFSMPSRAYCIARAAPPVALAAVMTANISPNVTGFSAADTAQEKPLSSMASLIFLMDTSCSTARTSGARLGSTLPASIHSSNFRRRFTSACLALPVRPRISSARSRTLSASSPASVTTYSSPRCAPKEITPRLGKSLRTM